MKENIICYYPYSVGYKSTYCGMSFFNVNEHTSVVKEVTCKKCLKKIKQLSE